MRNPSPLRYPGGKHKITPLIEFLIRKSQRCHTYVEPFAGGAGVALDLLLSGVVENIIINDSDRAISSFWKAALNETDSFVDKIMSVDLSLSEWKRQRSIYMNSRHYSFDYGFAAFYLNRTNHSGILASGPIGGREQSEWTLEARFNRKGLADRIKLIGLRREDISVYNRDVLSFMRNQLSKCGREAFVYYDPPYYQKGRVLYKNYFTHKLHQSLKNAVLADKCHPWVVSYDDVEDIRKIYCHVPCRSFALNYSLANKGKGREVMFFSNGLCPSDGELEALSIGSARFN